MKLACTSKYFFIIILLFTHSFLSSCSDSNNNTNDQPALDNNAELSSLSLSTAALSPIFSATTTSYTSSTAYNVSETSVTATTSSDKATLTINGTTVSSGSPHTINLAAGQTYINITVSAEDPASSRTYTISVTRSSFGITPATIEVTAGYSVTLYINLVEAALLDTNINLNSSDPTKVTVPATVTVPMGQSQAAFDATSIAAGPASVTITADLNSETTTATFNVLTPTCGDGIVDLGEGCDDGNSIANDGCSVVCQQESGWYCSGSPSTCTTSCGDAIVAGAESCDDGGSNGSTICGCQNNCTYTSAGTVCLLASSCEPDQYCDGAGACDKQHACDDTNPCTQDVCNNITTLCQYSATNCDDADKCTADSCDAGSGCVHTPIVCDDGNECTTNQCGSGIGCYYSAVANGTPCTGGSCQGGVCVN